MKRNPIYSPKFPHDNIEHTILRDDNGYFTTLNFQYANGVKQETKQEKFNRIFQVEDAKLVTA